MSVSAWCANELTVTGLSASLAGFAAAVAAPDTDEDASVLDFARICPVPASLDGDVHSGGCCTQRAGAPIDEECWRTQHWGCLTGAEDVEWEGSADGGWMRYRFATGYEPPIPLVMALGNGFPDLAFELVYVELSAILAGRLRHTPETWWRHAYSVGDVAAGRAILGPSRLSHHLEDVSRLGD